MPRQGNDFFCRESVEIILLFNTPEYLHSGRAHRPPGTIPWIYASKDFAQEINSWTMQKNPEAFSFPVYYAIGGDWYAIGKKLGLYGGQLVYWIRFLNGGIFALLIGITYLFCKKFYRDNPAIRFGVPLLLSFFPQNIFYAINSDVISPLLFLISLYLLLKIASEKISLPLSLLTGAAIAATFLIKISNIPILVVFIGFILLYALKPLNIKGAGKKSHFILTMVATAIIPIMLWLWWNKYALGDFSGSAAKVQYLGWNIKPFMEMWKHPLFSIHGLYLFCSEIIKTFWRGEFLWKSKTLCSNNMDFFFVISSVAFPLASIISTLNDEYGASHRRLVYLNASILIIYLLYLAALSVIYDFGNCYYPSRAFPYFASGRLMLGSLIPFLVLYIQGLVFILSRINKSINPLIVIFLICIIMMYAEIYTILPVFSSQYNWFHL